MKNVMYKNGSQYKIKMNKREEKEGKERKK